MIKSSYKDKSMELGQKQKLEIKFPNVQFRIKRLPPEEAANAWWNKDLD